MSQANDAPATAASEAVDGTLPQGTQELTVFVQRLLGQMQSRFTEMSHSIIERIDEMGARIDDLDRNVNDLMQQAGLDDETNDASAVKAH